MSYKVLTPEEAASLIKHGHHIGLSGFTPAGTAKAVTAALAKIAEAEHEKGNPFQVSVFTGASTGDSCDGSFPGPRQSATALPTPPTLISARR